MGYVNIQDSTINPERERREVEKQVRETIQDLNEFLKGESGTDITIASVEILWKALRSLQRTEKYDRENQED